MFAPKLYGVYKFPFVDIVRNNFSMSGDLSQYKINQQDSMLFRQIRLISGSDHKFNNYCVFVSCSGYNSRLSEFAEMLESGFTVNGHHFQLGERSASMTRQGILSFVDSRIADKLNDAVSMETEDGSNKVLSKYVAYRGLMFSSCHCFDEWLPKVIVVPDYFRTIENQTIKYVVDEESTYFDKEGVERSWTQKAIETGVKDIRINVFDGAGLYHPSLALELQNLLEIREPPTSIILRAPFIKGVCHSVDYTAFFYEHGIEYIEDMWGVFHDVKEPMIILTESMYKGTGYFKKYGDYRDWDRYWELFHKYNHCLGIAKWNFTKDEEPIYTRANYQILQDLELDYEDFSSLANDSIEWATKIVGGDIFSTYCFLGLGYDIHDPMNEYVRAILKNPEMIKESTVNTYVVGLLEKMINQFKCGKLWIKATFKFLAPDLIALMEHMGKIEIRGCLEHDEFWTNGVDGTYSGEFLIERNPHICKSEHVILNATTTDTIEKYLGHLSNVCMVNAKSITPQRLNGADMDGDLVLVVDNETMKSGVDRSCPVVIDIDDKITALSEPYDKEHLTKLVLRTMKSLIGETSNCATAYWNKNPKSEETKQKYLGYIDLLSVVNGKSIDASKTGVIFNIPRHIAKYSKPLPYFMKYASDYYGNMNVFNHAPSNMNRLAKDIEKWEKGFRYKRTHKDFDYTIMIDGLIEVDEDRFRKIESVFLEFCKEMSDVSSFGHKCKNFDKYKSYFSENYPDARREDLRNFEVNWKYYYDKYKSICREICPDKQELANIAVMLCYEKHPSKNKKFMWKVASEGILLNIRPKNILLPIKDRHGDKTYLGKRYSMKEVLDIDK